MSAHRGLMKARGTQYFSATCYSPTPAGVSHGSTSIDLPKPKVVTNNDHESEVSASPVPQPHKRAKLSKMNQSTDGAACPICLDGDFSGFILNRTQRYSARLRELL